MSPEQGNDHLPESPSPKTTVSFAPADPTDGRKPGAWRTRYEEAAMPYIRREAKYVGALFILIPIVLICIRQNLFGFLIIPAPVKKYGYAWVGGCLGGTLFCTKWLYHSIARNLWNEDRFLWRIFTPHISGALAFSFMMLISSGIVTLFSPTAMEKNSAVFGLSFLIGYFSDSAIAKLTEIANTIFGATQKESTKRVEHPAERKHDK